MNKIAFITGISGQDGSHLVEFLLSKEYKIYGLMRRTSTDNTWRIKNIIDKIEIVSGDVTDQSSLDRSINLIKPDEVYNLAAQSFVKASWDSPEYTFNTNAIGVIRLLEAILHFGKKETKIFHASTSEMFGKVQEQPQNENTKFYPRSIYGVSKLAGHWAAINYRESYNMFISCAISFNHESYRRGLEFVSRKISYNVAKIHLGLSDHIELGNLDSMRDFGYAPEYVEAFWKMLQLDNPVDLVLSTGETHSIKEFVEEAFKVVGIDNWKDYVKQNPKFMRPAEVDYLCGDSTKAKALIGWNPIIRFKEIVKVMVDSDIERLFRGDKID
jgi:GDPmannose 4,6-dehydratase